MDGKGKIEHSEASFSQNSSPTGVLLPSFWQRFLDVLPTKSSSVPVHVTVLLNYAADLEETCPRFPSDNTVPRQVAMALRGFDDHGPRSTIHAGELCADVPPQPLCCVHSVVVVEAAEEATNLPTEKGNSRRRSQSRCHALCSLLLVQFYRLWSSISALCSSASARQHEVHIHRCSTSPSHGTQRRGAPRHVQHTPTSRHGLRVNPGLVLDPKFGI
jgi:hypothetical protein